MSGYILDSEAILDMEEIWEFIAQDSARAADRVIDDIFAACKSLCILPHQGHRRPDLTSLTLRFRGVHDFLIVYDPDEDPLYVVAVLDGRRDPRLLAATFRDRLTQ